MKTIVLKGSTSIQQSKLMLGLVNRLLNENGLLRSRNIDGYQIKVKPTKIIISPLQEVYDIAV